MINIIKYNNRKLYSTETKKYVNALDLADLLSSRGESFNIRHHRTEVDVTYITLISLSASLHRLGHSFQGDLLLNYARLSLAARG